MKPAVKLVVLILLLVSVILIVFVFLYKNKLQVSNNQISDNSNTSAFNDLTKSTYFYVLDKYELTFSQDDYWQTWDVTTDYIAGDVKKVHVEDHTITLNIFNPADKEFSGTNRVIATCKDNLTVMVSSKNRAFIKGNFSLMDEVSQGDIVYANCHDATCNNIGDECVLVKRNEQ